jgi:hypothetical protein
MVGKVRVQLYKEHGTKLVFLVPLLCYNWFLEQRK